MTWEYTKDKEIQEENKALKEFSSQTSQQNAITLNCDYLELNLSSGGNPRVPRGNEYDVIRNQEVNHSAKIHVNKEDYADFVKQCTNQVPERRLGFESEIIIKPRTWSNPLHSGPFYFKDIRLTRIDHNPVDLSRDITLVFNDYDIMKRTEKEREYFITSERQQADAAEFEILGNDRSVRRIIK